MRKILLCGLLLVMGCVSRGKYLKVSEDLAKSLELNRKCIKHAEWMEWENKDLRGKNNDLLKKSGETDSEYKKRIDAYLALECLCKHKDVLRGWSGLK